MYAGMTVEEFEDDVSRWMHTARHLLTGRKLYGDGVPADD
jgi:hypothetical protein